MSVITAINPATEEVSGQFTLMDKAELDALIQTMHGVQQSWAKSLLDIRRQCLFDLGALLLQKKHQAATLMTIEMGKPISQALLEVEKCARLCEYYAKNGERFLKPEMVQTEFHKSYRSFHPLGIIFAIMPWNFPFWQVMRFALPNLMCGNAGLLKHAPNCLGTALFIEQLFVQAGFPEGLFRSAIIDVDLAPFVIHHPYVAGVTLTGSNRAGKQVAKEAGLALKKLVLELGGNDPYIILEDADLELAAQQCVLSRLNNAGQVCIAAKRLIVADRVKKPFKELLLKKVHEYQLGDPLDPKTRLGPMARNDLRLTVHDQVQRTIAAGAECLLGGELPKGKGFYYPATVLMDAPVQSPAFTEEIFGPVICITSAKDTDHALELANHTEYGLAGAIFTQDLKKGEQLARDYLHAGTCAVNTLVSSDPRLPFGGIKQSGYGRELAIEGMREFVNIKTVIVA